MHPTAHRVLSQWWRGCHHLGPPQRHCSGTPEVACAHRHREQVRGPHLRTLMPLTVPFLVPIFLWMCTFLLNFHTQRNLVYAKQVLSSSFQPTCSLVIAALGLLQNKPSLDTHCFGHQLNFLSAAMARCHNFPTPSRRTSWQCWTARLAAVCWTRPTTRQQ